MPRKKPKKYLAVANLFNLSVQDVLKYVKNLHQHIGQQNKRINKLKLKIRKMTFLSKLDQHLAKTAQETDKKHAENGKTTESSNLGNATAADEEQQKQEDVLDFVNEIKAQAEKVAWSQAGFIYEPTSGLYYDTKSTYYYSPEHDLYYNGNDGNWYRLNPNNEFIFHSGTEASKAAKKEVIDEDEAIRRILDEGRKPVKSVDEKVEKERKRRVSNSTSESSEDSRRGRRRRRSRSRRSRSRSRRSRSRSRHRDRRKNRRHRSRSSNREDGELDTSDGSESERQEIAQIEKFRRRKKKKRGTEHEEIAKKYPGSMRLIVIESDKLDVGKLFMVTYKGGSLGREGSHHDVLIPDVNISKNHLKFFYSHKKAVYQVTDASRNGTLIDGVQISTLNQEESDSWDLPHGSELQFSKTKLLCHVHEGLTTCDECEPYNYVKKQQEEPKSSDASQPSNLSHREGLKALQKRYGLQTEKYQENPTGTKNKNYEDRAEKRRVKIGSSHESVKTVQASVNHSISSENKGFKMLSKMGWSEGKSIGKSQEGIKEPVQVKTQQGTSGLGNESFVPINFQENYKKKAILSKTQARYNSINEKIFGDDE